jgi:rod shape determining protein RodA
MQAVLRRMSASLVDGLDATLIVVTLLLAAVGLATLYSASHDSPARMTGQLMNFAVAFAAMWVAARISPELLMRVAFPAYAVGLALLVAVALYGDTVNGARRWLHVGVTRFQPSEMMKLALPLMLAWYFARNEETLRLRDFAVGALLVAIPVLLIARQPDLGTAALVAAAGVYILYFAGLGWRVMATLAVLGGASLFPLWGLLHDYQRRRVLTLLDPSQDPLGAGYHTIQSTIAVGSGGVFGKGWLQGTQAHLEFIPERHTDFIFAVYSEEFGLLGNCLLLTLYTLLIGRGLDDHCAGDFVLLPSRRRRRDVDVLHLCVREHGNGGGNPPGRRRAAAVHFIRRYRARHALHRHRHPDEPAAPAAARPDLSFAAQQRNTKPVFVS